MALIELILTVVAWLTPAIDIVDAVVFTIFSVAIARSFSIRGCHRGVNRFQPWYQRLLFFMAITARGLVPLVVWFQHDISKSNSAIMLLFWWVGGHRPSSSTLDVSSFASRTSRAHCVRCAHRASYLRSSSCVKHRETSVGIVRPASCSLFFLCL